MSGAWAGLHDYHMHSYLCGHGSGVPADCAAQAVALGMDEIGISEHIPMYWLPPEQRDPEIAMRPEQMPLYLSMVEEARAAQPGLTVRLGIEADFIPGHEAELQSILTAYPFDYVYGSVHFIGAWGLDDERYLAEWERRDLLETYEQYFDLVEQAAGSGMFDIMAHLDLAKKFGYRPAADLTPLYRRVAATLADAGVCIEVSSAGLRKPIGEIYPGPDLLRICYAAGVPVTLGSDAHSPDLVGYEFPRLVRELKAIGYRRLARFKQRQVEFVPL